MRINNCTGAFIDLPDLGDCTIALVQIYFSPYRYTGAIDVQAVTVNIRYRARPVAAEIISPLLGSRTITRPLGRSYCS